MAEIERHNVLKFIEILKFPEQTPRSSRLILSMELTVFIRL